MKNRIQSLTGEFPTSASSDSVARMENAVAAPAQIDVQNRTVRHVILTDSLASDGGIILPESMSFDNYRANPIVTARHGGDPATIIRAPVIARSLTLDITTHEIWSVTQFADTELGREYAYLYGVNEAREIYMRAWSVEAPIYEKSVATVQRAKTLLGIAIDEDRLPASVRKTGQVWIATRSELSSYGAVPVGADRKALTRAMREGVVVAREILADIDFQDAKTQIEALRNENSAIRGELQKFEEELKALRRDGSAAAARGDTAVLLYELKQLTAEVKAINHK